jgi:tRNA pseudouridine55 synthase
MPILAYKDIGETPLEVVNKFRKPNKKCSFAGRLDPMARGKMIILQDLECKEQDKYCGLDKVYEFEILFGFTTDTYDILGIIEKYSPKLSEKLNININIKNYLGEFNQPYPQYSSMIVNKQPLWWWAKNNRIDEIEIPKKMINIYQIDYLGNIEIKDNLELFRQIKNKILKLNPNNLNQFRSFEILEKWENILKNNTFKPIIKKFRTKVSSGTYIRSLVNRIGEDIGLGAIAFDIHRTEILI